MTIDLPPSRIDLDPEQQTAANHYVSWWEGNDRVPLPDDHEEPPEHDHEDHGPSPQELAWLDQQTAPPVARPTTNTLTLRWVHDALDAPPPEPPELVEGFMRAGEILAIAAPRAFSKAQPLDTPILTPTGWTTMGALEVGSRVVGQDGKPTEVVAVHPQGTIPIWRVSFSDGTSTEACDDHLWTVRTAEKSWHTMRTWDLAMRIRWGKVKWPLWIPMAEPVQFDTGDPLPLDPYLLGLLLGDGGLTKNVTFTSGDPELFDVMEGLVPEGVTVHRWPDTRAVSLTTPRGKANPVLDALRALGLMGKKSEHKFIPEIYKRASIADRFALLQGLMDTDGTVIGRTCSVFGSSSPQLMADAREIVHGLGGTGNVTTSIPTYTHRGQKLEGLRTYQMALRLPPEFGWPFRLQRKLDRFGNRTPHDSRRVYRRITALEHVGDKPAQCITVAAPDGLYLTEHCIVTHNSWLTYNLAALLDKGEGLFLGQLPVKQKVRTLIAQGEIDEWNAWDRWRFMLNGDRPEGVAETFDRWRIRMMQRRNVTMDRDTGTSFTDNWFDALLPPEIENTIRENQFGLFIVDPWAVYFGGQENSNDEAERALDKLRDLAVTTGCAVLIVHHIRGRAMGDGVEPEDMWRGASRLADWASTRVTLLPHYKKESEWKKAGLSRQDARRICDVHFMRRGRATPDFSMAYDPRTGWWDRWVDPKELAAARVESKTTGAQQWNPPDVVAMLQAQGGSVPSIAMAATAMGVKSHHTAAKYLEGAVSAGLVEEVPRGSAKGYRVRPDGLFDAAGVPPVETVPLDVYDDLGEF